MKKIILLLIAVLLPVYAYSETHYVSPTGAASWANSTDIAQPCSLATANANAAAGDTVYLRGGDYSITVSAYAGAVSLTNSGTGADAKITYQAYSAGAWADRETPVITNATGYGWPNYRYGLYLSNKDYIVIKGITFVDWDWWGTIENGSDYNEVSYCVFYNTSTYYDAGGSSFGLFVQNRTGTAATHNWIHHNTFHSLSSPPCAESGDIIRIGSATAGDNESNYNTIEDNLMYHAGHTITDFFTHYNVIRNNVAYNDGFKTDLTHVTGTATGGSSTTLVDTSQNFGTACAGASCIGKYVHSLSESNAFGYYKALITSVSTTTNENDTINYTSAATAPTFANGHSYDISCLYWVDNDPPSNGKFAHRVFHIDSGTRDGLDYNLFEGNRAGHASPNPGNNGADNLSLSSGSCIVRYNSFFGSSGPGLYFKNGNAADNNRVYNNTIYGNGRFTGNGDPVSPIVTAGVYGTSAVSNIAFKNNIIYGNTSQFQCSSCSWDTAGNFCESADDWCAATGDPLFTNTTLTTPANSATEPNLTLQAGSPAIDGGTYLTTVKADDTGSGTSLMVEDALYFQDGTWGSSLAGHVADWICVGATLAAAECFQIGAINYATNTITVADFTREYGDKVWLYKKSDGTQVLYGNAPDYGAHESNHTATGSHRGLSIGGGVSIR